MAIENNENRPLSPGDRAVHISHPLPVDHQIIFLRPSSLMHTEEMIRRIVREELGKMSHHNLPSRLLPDANIQARYQLQFINKVKNPTFTTYLVRDDNGDPIKVAIYDTYTQSIISPDCFLSSAKVKLMVLNAEFWENKGETWSRGEFNQSVLKERERKGPILTGRSLIQLENGVGTYENIVFNDNSSWTKSGFQLGVMVEGGGEECYLNGEGVREGVGESFQVKDRRVKALQKPDLLNPKHGVQCIRKIGKSRASFLKKNNINTVEDFLHCYFNNEPGLRKILCIKSESGKDWESMVEHVKCADEYHTKCNSLNNSSCQPWPVRAEIRGEDANGGARESTAQVDPMGNISLSTNGGHRVVGSGSSEPNPSENEKIEDELFDLEEILNMIGNS